MTVILAILAMTTLRMKCFWGPYICIFAAVIVANKDIWNVIAAKLNGSGGDNSKFINFMRHITMGFVAIVVYSLYSEKIFKELENLREFYDPDTVELMEWINKSTPPTAAFMGSMQLLAGVRLSTFRPLTNHPHFEDKELRFRTKELYQVYARQQPEFVHDILVKYNASYIILEDSICMSKSDTRCNLPSTMDLTNGVIPDDGVADLPNLVKSRDPRFCHDIRYGAKKYTDLFTKVMENKTFRIYKVHSKDQIGKGPVA